MSNRTQEVIEKLKELKPDIDILERDMVKNNGITYHGVIIKETGVNISPVFYIENFDENYSVDEIAVMILNHLSSCGIDICDDIANIISDYSAIKDNLNLILINRELNKEMLKDLVYKEFMDLAIVPIIDISLTRNGERGIVKVTLDLMRNWNVTFDQLYSDAMNVFNKGRTVITNLTDVIRDAGIEDFIPGYLSMYVMTNENKSYGAARILDSSALDDLANELESNLIIIPSSVHECIIMAENSIDISGINELISEVNTDVVDENEVLAGHYYVYGRDFGWL